MICKHILLSLMIVTALIFNTETQTVHADEPLVFISAFAPGEKGAIYAFKLNLETGKLKLVQRNTDVEHPFFLALSPDKKFLYSIHAPGKFGGKENEFVTAYELLGDSGKLKRLNQQSSLGTASCYLDINKSGKAVVVANYSSGSVASLPIKKDGSLGKAASFIQHTGSSVDSRRQKEPHAHSIIVSPDQNFVFAADLGLDKVLSYKLDPETAKLSASPQPFVRTVPGAGPRHMTFHPNGKHLYIINELKNSVSAFDYDPKTGTLIEQETISTLPEDFKETSHCADVKITPNGRFLYGTNRGHDSIAAYKIDDKGKLTLLEIIPSLGKGPQNLAITANGKYLLCANMPGNNVVVFQIGEETGKLKAVGDPVSIPSPSCIMIR